MIDRPGLVEDVGHPGPVDHEGRRLERAGRDHEVALVLEDPVHPVDRLGRLVGGVDGEDVVELVLEVAGLVGSQAGERVRDGRGLQPGGGDFVKSTTYGT